MVPLLGCVSSAQTIVPLPDCGVRGSGAITIHEVNLGVFDINVAKSGSILLGGFKYTEITPDGRRVCTIYSQSLTRLEVLGNAATVQAFGYWNGMPSDLTVKCLDDVGGDYFYILARPRSPITIIYEAGGGLVKGDIVVFTAPATPQCLTKGNGTIAVGQNTGRFSFVAEKSGDVVKGTLKYVEYSPLADPTAQPPVRIYIPSVQTLRILSPNEVVFAGRGTLNERPAFVEVRVIDRTNGISPDLAARDEFYIRALMLATDSLSRIGYQAGGPLTSGDIVVAVQNVP